jgi:hypothetical protein
MPLVLKLEKAKPAAGRELDEIVVPKVAVDVLGLEFSAS